MPCPSDSAAGSPYCAACPPPLHYRNSETCTYRSHNLRDMPALGVPSRNCSCIALHPEIYCVKSCEKFSSELSASSHPRLLLTSVCLTRLPSVPAGSALSPAALCRGAAPGQSCLSAVLPTCHELPLSQKPVPASFPLPPLASLQVSLGLQGNLLCNRLKESLMFPLSAGDRHFFPTVSFLLSEAKLGMRITFPFLLRDRVRSKYRFPLSHQ